MSRNLFENNEGTEKAEQEDEIYTSTVQVFADGSLAEDPVITIDFVEEKPEPFSATEDQIALNRLRRGLSDK